MAKISKTYKPTQKEKFMNAKMKEYFRQKLENWKNELLKESSQTLNNLQTENEAKPDMTDRASEEIDRTFELRTRDRERKLINKIDAALRRIEDGTYGYCEETGEPIGLKRLEARPVATLSLEAQEMHEKAEKKTKLIKNNILGYKVDGKLLYPFFTPRYMLLILNKKQEWGIGQIQSSINNLITVNFENVGKKTINLEKINLEIININANN